MESDEPMSNLWVHAMPWRNLPGEAHRDTPSVRDAGFKGYVGASYHDDHYSDKDSKSDWDEDVYDEAAPEPKTHQLHHMEQHGDYPQSYYDAHDKAYEKGMEKKHSEDKPDHTDDDLHMFIGEHGANSDLWKAKATHGPVDIRKGVYATQSHVSRTHLDKYKANPQARTHAQGHDDYLGSHTPLFVTHQGRLHAIEGHHRVGAALERKDAFISGWHYDADKHGFPEDHEET